MIYICYRCGETTESRPAVCPHCGEENTMLSHVECSDLLNALYLKGEWVPEDVDEEYDAQL